tara:strand:+ start:47 stop:436 length:390 start_codon:yes stop_codon:yes gene_type:complete
MAVYTGKSLVVLFGSDTLTHVRSATVNHSIDLVEKTAAADTTKGYATTTKDFTATVEVLHDDSTDLFDSELVPGASGDLLIRPEGTASGAVVLTCPSIISSVEFGVPYDGVVAVSIGLQGNGALVVGTQ